MKQIFKSIGRVTLNILGWVKVLIFKAIILSLIIVCIGSILFYFSYCYGSQERLERKQQPIGVKKVNCFYIYLMDENGYLKFERAFPNVTLKFKNKTLEVKRGEIYDGTQRVTEKVSIESIGGKTGYRVYYNNDVYALTTTGSFKSYYFDSWDNLKMNGDMYCDNGLFFVKVDNRHEIAITILMIFMLWIVIWFIFQMSNSFYEWSTKQIKQRNEFLKRFKKNGKEKLEEKDD
jgi:uncharacterized protein YpmB